MTSSFSAEFGVSTAIALFGQLLVANVCWTDFLPCRVNRITTWGTNQTVRKQQNVGCNLDWYGDKFNPRMRTINKQKELAKRKRKERKKDLNISRTNFKIHHFPGLLNTGKQRHKIQALSRNLRTRTNPVQVTSRFPGDALVWVTAA